MAPRTAKSKKAAANNIKKSDKTKDVDEPKVDSEIAVDAAPIIKNKQKSTKKVTEEKQINGQDGDQPAKRGRKAKATKDSQESIKSVNGDLKETDQNSKDEESQEVDEEIQTNSKGKKQPKKTVEKIKKTQNAKESKIAKQASNEEIVEKKPAKGKVPKSQTKDDKKDSESVEEEVKEPEAKRSKKTKQNIVENDSNRNNDVEMEIKEKNVPKGRKTLTKKETVIEEEDVTPVVDDIKKKKVTKKELKSKDTISEEVEVTTKGKKSQKKIDVSAENSEETENSTGKRKRKVAAQKAPSNESKEKAPKNKNATDYETLDFSSDSKTQTGKEWNFKIASWNVDGIRAWLNKGGLDYIKYEKPDILCLQEVKCAQDKLPEEIVNLPGYHAYWLCSEKDGYAGVGIYTTKLAINVQYGLMNEELDSEGRIITAEYEQFYLICTYVPNAGRKLVTLPKRLQWNEEFRKHVKELDKKKPVIICGDMNVAHNEIDLKNPKTNRKNAGFTDEERSGMSDLLGDGFIDTYRHIYPDKSDSYTFWTYMMNSRAKNVGWRLDYFIISERLLPSLCDNVIRDGVYGSDHCPITLFLHLNGAIKSTEEFSPK